METMPLLPKVNGNNYPTRENRSSSWTSGEPRWVGGLSGPDVLTSTIYSHNLLT